MERTREGRSDGSDSMGSRVRVLGREEMEEEEEEGSFGKREENSRGWKRRN